MNTGFPFHRPVDFYVPRKGKVIFAMLAAATAE